MKILNIADSNGTFVNPDTGTKIEYDNWVINCLDLTAADGRDVKKPNGSGKYVCGNAIVQYKIKKSDLSRFYKGDIKDLLNKDFIAFFDQNSQLIGINIK